MPADRTYARIAFDEPRVGPLEVRVFDGEGTLLRTISTETLLKRPPAIPLQHAPIMGPASEPYPSVLAVRRQKASRNLTRLNKARRKVQS